MNIMASPDFCTLYLPLTTNSNKAVVRIDNLEEHWSHPKLLPEVLCAGTHVKTEKI
jgi:hypothetical protein